MHGVEEKLAEEVIENDEFCLIEMDEPLDLVPPEYTKFLNSGLEINSLCFSSANGVTAMELMMEKQELTKAYTT